MPHPKCIQCELPDGAGRSLHVAQPYRNALPRACEFCCPPKTWAWMLQQRQFIQNRMSSSHQKSTKGFSLLPLALARDKLNAQCHGAVTGVKCHLWQEKERLPCTDGHLLNLTDKNVVHSHNLFFFLFFFKCPFLSKFCRWDVSYI